MIYRLTRSDSDRREGKFIKNNVQYIASFVRAHKSRHSTTGVFKIELDDVKSPITPNAIEGDPSDICFISYITTEQICELEMCIGWNN